MFKKQIHGFHTSLLQVDVDRLEMEEFPKRYLFDLQQKALYYLHIYAECLQIISGQTGKSSSKIVLLDYGCGNGLLGLFARYCGFKEVIFIDTEKSFCNAIPELAAALGIQINNEYIICGQLPDIPAKLPLAHAVAGTDVIEHIYDPAVFFYDLQVYNSTIISVLTTASNCDNPFVVKRLQTLQERDEKEGLKEVNAQSGKQHPSFFQMRSEIIKANFADLNKEQIASLAAITRGKNKTDIINLVGSFLNKGEKIEPILHPTNTCDPFTGSWTERLTTISEYRKIYHENGFSLSVKNGFYNSWNRSFLKKIISTLTNNAIKIGGRKLAPFIFLVGKRHS